MKNNEIEIENIINEINEFFEKINKTAYKNIHLISSEVLSRNYFTNNFVKKVFKRKKHEKFTLKNIMQNLFIYYKRNFGHFYWFVRKYIAFKKIFKKDELQRNLYADTIYIIDNFLLVDKSLGDKKIADHYFCELSDVLKKRGKKFFWTPFFYDETPSLDRTIGIFKLLKFNINYYITEYELLKINDFIKIFVHILLFPFSVIKLVIGIGDGYKEKILKEELISELKNSLSFYRYGRYLFGKRLRSYFKNNKLVVISWFENQTLQKNYYKGLKTVLPHNCFIYGAKLYLYSRFYFSSEVIEQEKKFSVVPDKVLINGKYYLRFNKSASVAPSLRYKNVFRKYNVTREFDCLVILTYFKDFNNKILKIINQEFFYKLKVAFKVHPTSSITGIQLHKNWQIFEKNYPVSSLFERSDLIITSESGTCVEAVATGKSIIIVSHDDNLKSQYLTEIGENIIWKSVDSKKDIIKAYTQLRNERIKNFSKIEELSKWYKDNYFCEPTEKSIIKTFNI